MSINVWPFGLHLPCLAYICCAWPIIGPAVKVLSRKCWLFSDFSFRIWALTLFMYALNLRKHGCNDEPGVLETRSRGLIYFRDAKKLVSWEEPCIFCPWPGLLGAYAKMSRYSLKCAQFWEDCNTVQTRLKLPYSELWQTSIQNSKLVLGMSECVLYWKYTFMQFTL